MTVTAPAAGVAAGSPRHAARATGGPTPIGVFLRVSVLVLVAVYVFWVWPRDVDYAPIAAQAAIYSLVGLSLNIIIGYTGQLSLGHQGFFGAGAFAAAYTQQEYGFPFLVTLLFSVLVGAVVALLLGLVALRITGLYLALITLVFGLTLENSLFEVEEFTNAGAGQPAERPLFFIEDSKYIPADGKYYLFCVAIVALVLYLDWRLTKTKTGRALFALRENERVAAAFGINVTLYKLIAFVLSGAIAGLAGGLFAYLIGNVTGADFGFDLALTFVLMTVVGGLNSRLGVVLGSILFASLDYVLENTWMHNVSEFLFRGGTSQFAPLFIGALGLLLTLTLNPGGIAQQVRPITRWLAGEKFSLHHHGEAGPGAVEGSNVRA